MKQTYETTSDLNQLDKNELESLLPTVFNMLYDDIFSTKEGWILKENTQYTLKKLIEWRDQGAGPKIGIISNSDERLHLILKGNYYDLLIFNFYMKNKFYFNE